MAEENGWQEHKLLIKKDIQRLEESQKDLSESVRALNVEMVRELASTKEEVKDHFDTCMKNMHSHFEERIGITNKRVGTLERKESNSSAIKTFLLTALGILIGLGGLIVYFIK